MPILNNFRIKIIKNGPYIVSGNVPLMEKVIVYNDNSDHYEAGQLLPQAKDYALCRCGHSKNMPFCDGSHNEIHFNGAETASKEPYLNRAELFEGPGIVLTDEKRLCAFARLCHKEHGNVWSLMEKSGDKICREEAVQAACDCPSGRLVAWDRQTEEAIEPAYEPAVVILQDPGRQCNGPAWVRGRIPIESSDGSVYEIRNRVTLCRCGGSADKPFCDAAHVTASHYEIL
jgi:CDGSH-type Zn-finger protein